jgi:hypothetical protein
VCICMYTVNTLYLYCDVIGDYTVKSPFQKQNEFFNRLQFIVPFTGVCRFADHNPVSLGIMFCSAS